jgi:aminopeptidase N
MDKVRKNYFLFICLAFLLVYGCAGKKELLQEKEIAEDVKKVNLREIEVTPDDSESEEEMSEDENSKDVELESTRKVHPFRTYRASPRKDFALMHTKIDVSFDWTKQHVIGKTNLTLKPQFYNQSELKLDAKGFDIKKIALMPSGKELKYQYDGAVITIQLEKKYSRNDQLEIFVDYIARPEEGPQGGSNAITSDKGLFFINPLGSEPDKPMQIWTQGETENNSRWFPTIDKPNQFTTQEISITVEDKFVTLSNGIKVSSKKNSDGTRTDIWKQDKPHAPYLTMIAVGDFAVVKDQWKNIPLEYIVEKSHAPYAKAIFNHTPEMLDFFSGKLDYPFAWDKYSQIIVRDYVSGAMENTTAAVFGEFVQKNDKELIDDDNDAIVAHEMFHHWFGNIVTCESWSNLTLQEGMANYAEYMWLEHKYGKVRADLHRLNEMQGYLSSTQQGSTHPLIRYVYGDKEEMFDAHSYNKGGLVLHMLKTYVGEDAFFAALNLYLNKHKHTAVEVDELRMAFEDVTGEDLNWFFDQWFLTEGHPNISFSYAYDSNTKKIKGVVTQNQIPAFRIPFDVAIMNNTGVPTYHKIWIENQVDSFYISTDQAPSVVILDGKEDILAEIETKHSEEELYTIFSNSPEPIQRFNAFNQLSYSVEDYTKLITIGIDDKIHTVQSNAINMISEDLFPILKEKINNYAVQADHSEVRAAAVNKLGENLALSKSLIQSIFTNERSNLVLSAALAGYANLDLDEAIAEAEKFDKAGDDGMIEGIASVFAQDSKSDRLAWFLNGVKNKNIYKAYPLFQYLISYAVNKNDQGVTFGKIGEEMFSMATDSKVDKFKRYVSAMTIFAIKSQAAEEGGEKMNIDVTKFNQYLKDILAIEKDPLLLERYKSQF